MVKMVLYELLEGLFCFLFLLFLCMKKKGCGVCGGILGVRWLSKFFREKKNGIIKCKLDVFRFLCNRKRGCDYVEVEVDV